MEQQKSFKDKTMNDWERATPLYKADILRVTSDTLRMNTKQSVNFLQVSFLQKRECLWPRLCRNVYDYSRRKRLFSCIPQVSTSQMITSARRRWRRLIPSLFIERICSRGNTSSWSSSTEVVFSENHHRSQKVYILCRGSPTGWHHSALHALHKLNSQIFTLMTHY